MYSYKYKNTVVAILLACILTMAVGYAALQQRLNITGTSSISSVYDVRFTNIKSTPSNENVTDKVAPSYTNTTATFSTNLTSPGDTMTYDITVSNLGTLDAKLILVTMSDSNNPAIEFTYEGVKAGDVLKSQESTVVKVTVKYSDTVTTQPDSISSDLTIKLDYSQIGVMTQEEILAEGNFLAQAIPESNWLNGPLSRMDIESISFTTTNEIPTEAGENYWDASHAGNGSVIAWYIDSDSDGVYEVTIGQDGGVKANPNSSYLFYGFYEDLGDEIGLISNLENIDLANFDTSYATDMSYMFYSLNYINGIDVSNFDTSNVTNMSYMFYDSKVGPINVSNFRTGRVTDMSFMFSKSYNLGELNLSNFDTSNVTNMASMFENSDLASLNLSNWNTSKVTNMSSMFDYIYDLTELDLSSFNTSNVTDMSFMFYHLVNLTSLDISSFNTSKVTDMSYMFDNVYNLTSLNLSHFKTSNVTSMSNMFAGMSALETLDISSFDTSKVTSMNHMFYSCGNLKSLDVSHFKTQNVTDMAWMFYTMYDITELDVSGFDTSKVTNMAHMFYGLHNVSTLDVSNFNTSKVENMDSMFSAIYKITTLDLSKWDTSNVKDMGNMFAYSNQLVELDLSSFDTSKVEDMGWMFERCTNLKTIYASELWSTAAVTYGVYMFDSATSLVGGNGRTYSYGARGYEYANYETGYFTYKAHS